MTNQHPDEVLGFWFGEGAGYGKRRKRWFEKDPAFDAEITRRFLALHDQLAADRRWFDGPRACLARILVLDQFPRNMFRGTARAFASDPLALEAAVHALDNHYDQQLLPVE